MSTTLLTPNGRFASADDQLVEVARDELAAALAALGEPRAQPDEPAARHRATVMDEHASDER